MRRVNTREWRERKEEKKELSGKHSTGVKVCFLIQLISPGSLSIRFLSSPCLDIEREKERMKGKKEMAS